MCLVHDHGEALAGKLTYLLGDDGKLLQGGDDDGPASFEGIPELAGGLIDVFHHAEGLLELPDGALQLAVEYPSIRHHDHGVEDASGLHYHGAPKAGGRAKQW